MHPFRFGAVVGAVSARADWVERVLQAEAFGYDVVLCTDHFTTKLAPVPALVSAAELTELRVGTYVLANDFRHPAAVAKEAATVDVLSEGRMELGIGAGWLRSDYRPLGIPFDRPGVRIDRLEEAVAVIRGCWAEGPFDFEGSHYRIEGYEGFPKPVQDSIPLMLGGGGPRMLRLAGRLADIVGISLDLRKATADALAAEIAGAGSALARRIEWIRQGAGDRFADLQLTVLLFGVEIGDRRQGLARLAERFDTTPEAAAASPHLLAGSVDEVCDVLRERRERYGINYLAVGEGDLEAMAPVVDRLSGT